MMIQGFRLLPGILLALFSSSLFALGLGELEVKSRLNQPFDAEIVLTHVGALEPDEITADLASPEDFDRVGIPRDYYLTDLRFAVRQRQDGQFIIHVTSGEPIIEPFLDFITAVTWPTGRILREYTALMDLPVPDAGGVEEITPAVREGRASSDSAGAVDSGRTEAVAGRDDEYGPTGRGDTLWTIASKVRPGSVSVQQTMLALQRANPGAFIANNINLLKAGHVLRIPDINEIRMQAAADAMAEVGLQNEEYLSGKVTQFDARPRTQQGRVSPDAGEEGELKLLAADRIEGDRSGAADEQVVELERELALVREDLDQERRANSEMNLRLDDLEKQIQTLTELVRLKDDQLAALTAELNRDRAATRAGAALLADPVLAGGLALFLVVAVLGGLILMRRRRQFDDDTGDFADSLPEDEPSLHPDDEMTEAAEQTRQTSDLIEEAEVDISYGRFPEAISFLKQAIEREPDRTDVHLKLLEVYRQTEDATAFEQQLEQLMMIGDEDATNAAMALQAQPDAEGDAPPEAETIASSEPITATRASVDEDDEEPDFEDDDLDPGDLDDNPDDDLDDDLDELDEDMSSKLDLARAYIEMGDSDGARSLLEEVLREGDARQVSEANELLARIG